MGNTVIVGNVSVKIRGSRKQLTQKMYSWSKYGGVGYGLVQETVTPEWICQGCSEMQTDELPPYMFEFIPREYIRICSKCQHQRLTHMIKTFADLVAFVRRPHTIYDTHSL